MSTSDASTVTFMSGATAEKHYGNFRVTVPASESHARDRADARRLARSHFGPCADVTGRYYQVQGREPYSDATQYRRGYAVTIVGGTEDYAQALNRHDMTAGRIR